MPWRAAATVIVPADCGDAHPFAAALSGTLTELVSSLGPALNCTVAAEGAPRQGRCRRQNPPAVAVQPECLNACLHFHFNCNACGWQPCQAASLRPNSPAEVGGTPDANTHSRVASARRHVHVGLWPAIAGSWQSPRSRRSSTHQRPLRPACDPRREVTSALRDGGASEW